MNALPRTDSPFLGSCPASGGASSFLRASTLFTPPRDLAISRRARRAMRLTDFCHLIDLRAPVLRAFPARSAAFTAWTLTLLGCAACAAHGVLGSVKLDRGTECFHDTRERFGGSLRDTRCLFLPLYPAPFRCVRKSVGVFFPRRLLSIMPLTPLSPLPLSRNVSAGPSLCLPVARARVSRSRSFPA